MRKFLIIGAGFGGAVLARELVSRCECQVEVLDERPHLAGNCHTERDDRSGVMVHKYGPHIFNTNHQDVWDYVNRFVPIMPWINRVKAQTARGVFSLPINLHTINQFYGQTFSPAEARAFLAQQSDTTIGEPANFEEQALKFIGRELYEAFFYGYTRKQWGCEPRELPASILKRLPVRFSYDDNYYNSAHQGIPRDGYSEIVRRILDHPGITLRLKTRWEPNGHDKADHVFYSGPLDAFFGCKLGRLSYRTVTFEQIDAEGDLQGNAVINYTDLQVPFTRIHEHKHFAPWEKHERTIAFREFSKETGADDVPYYPKRLEPDLTLLEKYRELAVQTPGVSFLGRLGTYRYLDMDQVIGESLDFAEICLQALGANQPIPAFSPAPPRPK